MKNYVTKFIKSVAIFYFGFPIFYMVGAALLFDIPSGLWLRILLSPSYYILSIMAITVGYALWEVRRWGWYLLVTVNILMSYLNAVVVNEFGATHHKGLSYVISLLFLAIITYRVAREIRVPYFFPKIRWWESNPRYRLSVPVKLARIQHPQLKDAPPMDGQILDISMTGCFVKLRGDIAQHETIALKFTVFGFTLECEGVVVWRTTSTVTHPKGVGIKFRQLERPQRRCLRQIHSRLRKINAFYRRSRYLLNQDEFQKKFQELEANGAMQKKRASG